MRAFDLDRNIFHRWPQQVVLERSGWHEIITHRYNNSGPATSANLLLWMISFGNHGFYDPSEVDMKRFHNYYCIDHPIRRRGPKSG